MAVSIHLVAALCAICLGAYQLLMPKGTQAHRGVGWSWMVAMAVVAVSSFWLTGLMDLLCGFSFIHLLSVWVLICLPASIHSARKRNIRRHKAFAVGAFCGVVDAGMGALAPGRLLHSWIFGG